MTKEIRFAKAMSELLFTLRNESDAEVEDVSKERSDAIADDPIHICEIKLRIFKHVFEAVTNYPQAFTQDENGEFKYTTDVYDYSYAYDTYIQELVEKERQSKLRTIYKVSIKIEPIEINEGDGGYSDEDDPIGIGYFDTMDEAEKFVKSVDEMFEL